MADDANRKRGLAQADRLLAARSMGDIPRSYNRDCDVGWPIALSETDENAANEFPESGRIGKIQGHRENLMPSVLRQ
jgi:hypothetical protein